VKIEFVLATGAFDLSKILHRTIDSLILVLNADLQTERFVYAKEMFDNEISTG